MRLKISAGSGGDVQLRFVFMAKRCFTVFGFLFAEVLCCSLVKYWFSPYNYVHEHYYGQFMAKIIGTVLGGSNNVFEVECVSESSHGHTSLVRICTLKSKRLKSEKKYYNPLAPGDSVEISVDDLEDKKGQIVALLPRKNEFVRRNIKGRTPQLLAANLDCLIAVTTPDEPPFRPRFIDRILVQAEYQNIQAIIVCNKYDLPASQSPALQQRLSAWEDLGYKVLRLSAQSGEGMTEFAELLSGKTSALVGQSGVGKSSLVNVLDNSCVLKIGSLSEKYGKGKHTTSKGSLMRININESLIGGIHGASASIIDTPGVKKFILHNIPANDVALYFREMKPFVGKCAFGMSCTHTSEAGCKILEAVYSGLINEDRYKSWKKITEEIKTGKWQTE